MPLTELSSGSSMAPGDQSGHIKARRILAALKLDDAAIASLRAPEVSRLRLDRPDLSTDEAADLFAAALVRLGPRGMAATLSGRRVLGSDPPYPEILAWVDAVRPRTATNPADVEDAPESPVTAVGTPSRDRGRPSWTKLEFDRHFAEALAETGPMPTDAQVAAHFRPLSGGPGDTIEPATFGRLRRRFHRNAAQPHS
jgi:hypothetical protein